MSSWLDEYAAALCSGFANCPTGIPWDRIEECTRAFPAIRRQTQGESIVPWTARALIDEGVIEVDPDEARACIASLRTRCPTLDIATAAGARNDPCSRALRTRSARPLGAHCTLSSECGAAATCRYVAHAGDCFRRECAPKLTAGSECHASTECDSAAGGDFATCANDGTGTFRCAAGRFAAPASVGLPCWQVGRDGAVLIWADCEAGTVCDVPPGVVTGTCMPVLVDGADCAGESDLTCARGAACQLQSGAWRCAPIVILRNVVGDSCDVLTAPCDVVSGLVCDPGRDVCVASTGLIGEPCAGLTCTDGAYCDSSFRCANASVSIGGVCDRDTACASRCCRGETATTPGECTEP